MTLTVLALEQQQNKMFASALPMNQLQQWQQQQQPKSYQILNNSTKLIWENPCRGVFDERKATYSNNKTNARKKISRELQRHLSNELSTIRRVKNSRSNIGGVKHWSTYNETYKFLPELRNNTSLRGNHRDMQIFLAAIAFLKHAAIQSKDPAVKELKLLEDTALSALCGIEIAYNDTMKLRKSRKSRIKIVNPKVMSRILKFITVLNDNDIQYVNQIDLKFIKYKFLLYTQQMVKNLKAKYPRNKQATGDAGSNDIRRMNSGNRKSSSSGVQKTQSPNSNTNVKVNGENNTIKINNRFQLQQHTRGNTSKRRKLPAKNF